MQVIEARFPHLSKSAQSAQKLVDIYQALLNRHDTVDDSVSMFDEDSNKVNAENKKRFSSHNSRPMSTR